MIQNYGADWTKFLEDLEGLDSSFRVLGINDYLSLQGYKTIHAFRAEGRLKNFEAIFPVVEIRLEQLAGGPEHLRRVNYHIIFDPELDVDIIQQQFLNAIAPSYHLNADVPEELTWQQVITPASLQELGHLLRQNTPEAARPKLPKSDLLLGFNNVSVSLDAVRDILRRPHFEDRFLTAVGKAEWASMQWTEQTVALKKNVINSADLVFSATESPSAYQEARAALTDAGINARLLDCSDAHSLSGSTDKDRIGNCHTWVNATPSMRGLQHAMTEFDNRIYVGVEPEKLTSIRKTPSSHIKSLRVSKKTSSSAPHEFFDTTLQLNPGFIAIVGNKGNGKSALLDVIGLVTSSTNYPDFTFLSPERFLDPRSNPAQHYEAEIDWHSGESHARSLDYEGTEDDVERSTYLPQQLIDAICEPDITRAGERFNRALGAVLFSHVPQDERLGETSFEDLIAKRTQAVDARLAVLRGELAEINAYIADAERQLKPGREKTLRAELADVRSRLVTLKENPPRNPQDLEPKLDPAVQETRDEIIELLEQKKALLNEKSSIENNLASIATRLDTLQQITTALETLKGQVEGFKSRYASDVEGLGLDIDLLVNVSIQSQSVLELSNAEQEKRTSLRELLNGPVETSVESRLQVLLTHINERELKLDVKSREYAETVRVYGEWQESISDLQNGTPKTRGIAQIEQDLANLASLPKRLNELREVRSKKSMEIHTTLLNIVRIYESLYAPARQFIEDHELGEKAELEFAATLRQTDFASTFFGMIGRHVSSTFYGEEADRRLAKLLDVTDFGSTESCLEFAGKVHQALHFDLRDDQQTPVQVDRLIRAGSSVEELYEYLFGFSFLEPYYILQFSGVPVDRLSPGQKGTLLLMFYLLVDPPTRPLLLDQPDENLDNQTIMQLLVPALKETKGRRQVIVITHNPNVAIVADADQIIFANFRDDVFEYVSGAIEDPNINRHVVDVLEGTWQAFDNRRRKYIPRLLTMSK